MFRDLISQKIFKNIKFKYVILDRWFSVKDNVIDIKIKHQNDFVLLVKSKRILTLSEENKIK